MLVVLRRLRILFVVSVPVCVTVLPLGRGGWYRPAEPRVAAAEAAKPGGVAVAAIPAVAVGAVLAAGEPSVPARAESGSSRPRRRARWWPARYEVRRSSR